MKKTGPWWCDSKNCKPKNQKTRPHLPPSWHPLWDLLYNFSHCICRPHLPPYWYPLWDLLNSFSNTAPDLVCRLFYLAFPFFLLYFHAKCALLYPPVIYHFLHRMFGDPREMVLHYFLADDTVEIREIVTANSGRDAVPLFLRRQKLPKVNNGKFNWKISWKWIYIFCYEAIASPLGNIIELFWWSSRSHDLSSYK